MDQKNVARLENMIREIIETLSEDMNEADPLCPDSDLSPFRQLIGSLKMELATLRILYPEEPTAPHTEISEIATTQPPELPTTEPLPPWPRRFATHRKNSRQASCKTHTRACAGH